MGQTEMGRYCKQAANRNGSYPKCGRSGGEKRKNYPKCVPIAKARAMSKGQTCGCRKTNEKTSESKYWPTTPSRAATFAKKKKQHNEKEYSKGTMPCKKGQKEF